jgi:hypothetical protein
MQLELNMGEGAPSTEKRSQAQYRVVVSCNKCGGVHEMGIFVLLDDGPLSQQSIGARYKGKTLPKSLADLVNNSITCPKTGRQSTQKNNEQIFLVPPKN